MLKQAQTSSNKLKQAQTSSNKSKWTFVPQKALIFLDDISSKKISAFF